MLMMAAQSLRRRAYGGMTPRGGGRHRGTTPRGPWRDAGHAPPSVRQRDLFSRTDRVLPPRARPRHPGSAGPGGQTGLDLALEDLAGRPERQLGAELVLPGLLVPGQLGAAQLAQFGLQPPGIGVAPGHDDRDRGLTPF